MKKLIKKIEALELHAIDKENLLMILTCLDIVVKETGGLGRQDGIQLLYIMNDVLARNHVDICISRDIINEIVGKYGITFNEITMLYVKIDYKKTLSKEKVKKILDILEPTFKENRLPQGHHIIENNSLIIVWNLLKNVDVHNDNELNNYSMQMQALSDIVEDKLEKTILNNPYRTDKVYSKAFLDIFTVSNLNNILPILKKEE